MKTKPAWIPVLTLDTLRRNFGFRYAELINKADYSKAISFALDTKVLALDILDRTQEDVQGFLKNVTDAINSAKVCKYSDVWALNL